jgi:hypothetical protein
VVARAQRFLLANCRRDCSLNPINLPGIAADVVHSMYEAGDNREAIRQYLLTQGVSVSDGAIGNHKRKHLEPIVAATGVGFAKPGAPPKKKTHLEILEQIIQSGGETLDIKSTRISPEMLMKAIEMHHKLTEGSVWEDFLGAIGAMGDEMTGGPENPAAVESAGEQAQAVVE